jgi:hypothetical protein
VTSCSINKFVAVADKSFREGDYDKDEQDFFTNPTDRSFYKKNYLHVSTISTCFASAILMTDPWSSATKLPPNFENVVNWIMFNSRRHFEDDVVPLSAVEACKLLRLWANENLAFRAWSSRLKTESIFINFMHLVRDEAVRMYMEKQMFKQELNKRKKNDSNSHRKQQSR